MAKAHDVAEHILAKIDEIVQSGDLDNEAPAPVPLGMSPGSYTTATIQSKARECLKVLTNTLDSVTRSAAHEPPKDVLPKAIIGVSLDDL